MQELKELAKTRGFDLLKLIQELEYSGADETILDGLYVPASEVVPFVRDMLKLDQLIQAHSEVLGFGWHRNQALYHRTKAVIEKYQDRSVSAIDRAKIFRDDVMTWLRAIAIVVEGFARGGTHREKEARAGMMLETIEGALAKLHDLDFKMDYFALHYPDIFSSDYPTRHYVRKIHDLEAEIHRLTHTEVTIHEEPPAEVRADEIPF